MQKYGRDYRMYKRYKRNTDRAMRSRRKDYNHDYRNRPDNYGEWEAAMHGEYKHDGRRGVKGTGPYGIGGKYYYGSDRAPYPEDMDYRKDYRKDYRYEEDDYYPYDRDYTDGEDMRLTDEEMTEWKHALKNSDGTRGEHFTKDKVLEAARRLNIMFDNYTEKDLVMAANMLYSDLGHAFKAYIPQDKEVVAYTKAARAWLEDEDAAVRGSEKLACYFDDFVAPELE